MKNVAEEKEEEGERRRRAPITEMWHTDAKPSILPTGVKGRQRINSWRRWQGRQAGMGDYAKRETPQISARTPAPPHLRRQRQEEEGAAARKIANLAQPGLGGGGKHGRHHQAYGRIEKGRRRRRAKRKQLRVRMTDS